jgi:hypothetical protein
MDSGIILLFAMVLVIGVILFAFISFGKNRGKVLNVERYRTRWMEIEQSIIRDNEASYHMAILNADKLVDQALRDRGFSGQTMGERLKATRGKLSHREDMWTAHKLRNRIAHEEGVRVNYNQARRSLNAFKHTLKDLGAI